VEKPILLLVIYLPPVTFLYEDYFLTVGCNIDCCVGGLYIWNRNNGVLRVTTTKNVFGITTTENVFGVAMVSWSRNTKSTLGVATVGVQLEEYTWSCNSWIVPGIATKMYCNHCEELQLLYYSCVAVLVHESNKFL
jgi:hypothetical protein